MNIQDYTYKVLIPKTGGAPLMTPALWEGAHYYGYSKALTMAEYDEAYAEITLPYDIVRVGSDGMERNAYIALGMASLGENLTCDMGLGNWGKGWFLCFGGLATLDEKGRPTVIPQDHLIPAEANKVKLYVKNDASGDTVDQAKMVIYAQFYKDSKYLSEDEFTHMVKKPKNGWNRFYRFASLLHNADENDVNTWNSLTDGTRMLGTKFGNAKLHITGTSTYVDWGFYSSLMANLWAIAYPVHASFRAMTVTGEIFDIDNS